MVLVIRAMLILLIGSLLLQFGCSERTRYRTEIRQVNAAVAEIEAFRKREGRLPAVGEVLGSTGRDCDMLRGDVCMFYQVACGSYVVGFDVGFDDHYYYDASRACWSFECNARSLPLKGAFGGPC